jgi:inosine-uridine nucleoside N-ribohydrolase
MPFTALTGEEEKELYRLQHLYWREALRCEESKAYLAGCVMLGSALETLLILMVNCYSDEADQTGKGSHDKGQTKAGIGDYAEVVRMVRNLWIAGVNKYEVFVNGIMVTRCFAWLAIFVFGAPLPDGHGSVSVIVDTDAGTDDLMAIAFLLARKDVRIEAITVVDGLAHVQAGGRNVLRLLAVAGAGEVPVYLGRTEPLARTAPFPAEWRQTSDTLPGVTLPASARAPERRAAADFLVTRLADSGRKVSILALGPLTNLGEAIRRAPNSVRGISELVIMGGAVRVRGNLDDGGFFKTSNSTAEWNIFHDPLAADIVLGSGVKTRMIPLDATNKVPIDMAFFEELSRRHTPLAEVVTQILKTEQPLIEQGIFFAWDPLAAVALVDRSVVRSRRLAIRVMRRPPEEGRTKEVSGQANVSVALDADAGAFRGVFLNAFR